MEAPMEVFIKNIPYAADEIELTRTLARVLHSTPFQEFMGGARYNFIVRLHKERRHSRNKHAGRAIILVPNRSIGDRFIALSKTQPITIYGRRLHCEVADRQRPALEDIALLSEPYRDPAILEEEQRRRADLGLPGITIREVSFGWHSYDDTLSFEWDSKPGVSWSLVFETEPVRLVLRSTENIFIVIHLRLIESAATSGSSLIIWVEHPPIFEKGDTSVETIMAALSLDGIRPLRNRLTSPDPEHEELFGLLRVIRINFREGSSKAEFQRRAAMVNLNTYELTNNVMKMGFFGPAAMSTYRLCLTRLPFSVAFQVHSLVTRGHFNPREIIGIYPSIEGAIKKHDKRTIARCIQDLEYARDQRPRESIDSLFRQLVEECDKNGTKRQLRDLPRDKEVFECHHVMITPTSVILRGPFPDESNRVIRKYKDYQRYFLRVEFKEEDRLQLRTERGVATNQVVDGKFRKSLHEGIIIAGRKFEFLGYSSSSLREHSVWFMLPFMKEGELVTPDFIRESLGDFSKVIKSPARYGARIAQAFSATEDGTVTLPDRIILERDLQSPINSLYTDGVGKLSPDLAKEIWEEYTKSRSKRSRRRLPTPSAFQIRLGGAKGMLCVDTRLRGRVLTIRDSMNKFESNDRKVEIARAFDRPMPMYLNRFLIMLLETLGVELRPIMDLQQTAVDEVKMAASSITSAAQLLDKYGLGTEYKLSSIFRHLSRIGVDIDSRESDQVVVSFLRRALSFAVNHILRDMKYKARIPVPKAWTLAGVADEWNYLKEGQIYAYVCATDGRKEYIKGPVLISRSPTVHPGDARMVWAIGEPPPNAPDGLKAITNCVVFPCAGQRSLPSMLAGGDLDGDIFCLVMDERLHPKYQYSPGSYLPSPIVKLTRNATGTDVADFVIDYIKNDLLGKIAVQLLLTADISPLCMRDNDCLQLAELHSHAVDFPKTGHHVEHTQLPKPKSKIKPDWYASELGEKHTTLYPSQRIIGHLFRAIELPAPPDASKLARKQLGQIAKDNEKDLVMRDVYRALQRRNNSFSNRLWSRLEDYIDLEEYECSKITSIIQEILDVYDSHWGDLVYVCKSHALSRNTPISEEELVASTIAQKCAQPRQRQDMITAMRRDSTELYERTREDIEGPEDIGKEEKLLRGWIAWNVSMTYKDAYAAMSFGLIGLESMFSTMREIDKSTRYRR